MASGLKLVLRWRPRGQNTMADELTNENFTNVDERKRVALCLADLKLDWLFELWEQREDFLDRESWSFYQLKSADPKGSKSKW